MNVIQNKMILFPVGKKKVYTKQKAWVCINPFMNLWLKENVLLFLTDLTHLRKGE